MPSLGLYIKEVNYGTQLALNKKQEICFMTLSQEKMPSEIIRGKKHWKCTHSSVLLFSKFQTSHLCNVDCCGKWHWWLFRKCKKFSTIHHGYKECYAISQFLQSLSENKKVGNNQKNVKLEHTRGFSITAKKFTDRISSG